MASSEEESTNAAGSAEDKQTFTPTVVIILIVSLIVWSMATALLVYMLHRYFKKRHLRRKEGLAANRIVELEGEEEEEVGGENYERAPEELTSIVDEDAASKESRESAVLSQENVISRHSAETAAASAHSKLPSSPDVDESKPHDDGHTLSGTYIGQSGEEGIYTSSSSSFLPSSSNYINTNDSLPSNNYLRTLEEYSYEQQQAVQVNMTLRVIQRPQREQVAEVTTYCTRSVHAAVTLIYKGILIVSSARVVRFRIHQRFHHLSSNLLWGRGQHCGSMKRNSRLYTRRVGSLV
jgi:hypothetical protein